MLETVGVGKSYAGYIYIFACLSLFPSTTSREWQTTSNLWLIICSPSFCFHCLSKSSMNEVNSSISLPFSVFHKQINKYDFCFFASLSTPIQYNLTRSFVGQLFFKKTHDFINSLKHYLNSPRTTVHVNMVCCSAIMQLLVRTW